VILHKITPEKKEHLMFPAPVLKKAEELIAACRESHTRLITAESCTGGLIGGVLTEIPGSSDVYERGHIVYSNHAKSVLLGVLPDTLNTYGAVSAETAAAMAQGALRHHPREDAETCRYLAVSVTGIAGPGGGNAEKPVGTVWFGCAVISPHDQTVHTLTEKHIFPGDRHAVRLAAIDKALDLLSDKLLT